MPSAPGSAARTRTCRRRSPGYRPQLVASLSPACRRCATSCPTTPCRARRLKPWTIGLTVTQVLFNGYKTANNVRVAEFQVKSGREALAQHRAGRVSRCGDGLHERDGQLRAGRGAAHQRPGAAGNPGDDETAARCRRRHADRYRAGRSPASAGDSPISTPPRSRLRSARRSTRRSSARRRRQLTAASPVDRLIPPTQAASIEAASHEHPAVLGAGYDVDVAQTSIKLAESALLPQVSVQGSVSRQVQNDPTLSVRRDRSGLGRGPDQRADLRRRHGGLADAPGQGSHLAEPARARAGPEPDAHRRGQRLGVQRRHQDRAARRGIRGEGGRHRAAGGAARGARAGSAPPSTCSMRSRT